mmetsp:Transcript_17208/g.55612  ORF Transcript_17208/g.55612 Transcript_17208/m.55612 type:complete len:205 (+) Transcript_17208:32-646(+)
MPVCPICALRADYAHATAAAGGPFSLSFASASQPGWPSNMPLSQTCSVSPTLWGLPMPTPVGVICDAAAAGGGSCTKGGRRSRPSSRPGAVATRLSSGPAPSPRRPGGACESDGGAAAGWRRAGSAREATPSGLEVSCGTATEVALSTHSRMPSNPAIEAMMLSWTKPLIFMKCVSCNTLTSTTLLTTSPKPLRSLLASLKATV